jgi:hypothetical protein
MIEYLVLFLLLRTVIISANACSDSFGATFHDQAAESFMIKTEDFSCFGNLLSFEPSGILQST